jgi:hypothetical protein
MMKLGDMNDGEGNWEDILAGEPAAAAAHDVEWSIESREA